MAKEAGKQWFETLEGLAEASPEIVGSINHKHLGKTISLLAREIHQLKQEFQKETKCLKIRGIKCL